jgi:hypothetical protein
MSQENVDIIRRGYGHFMATGELRARADLVWDVSRLGWPDQQIYPGVEGAMQFMAEWASLQRTAGARLVSGTPAL